MIRKLYRMFLATILPVGLFLGCGEMGKVDQGRVIEYDKAKGIVTLIQDKKADPGAPDYSTLPPHTYTIPADPREMGPEPKPGKRMKLDVDKREIVIFDSATQNFKTIKFDLVDKKEGVAKDDPLVAGKTFPIIDKEKRTISVYSGRQKLLVVFSVPEEYFALPPDTWEAGDEVRIYYKEPGKALRLMNITRTDIFKK